MHVHTPSQSESVLEPVFYQETNAAQYTCKSM